MIQNIIDNRTKRYRWKMVNAFAEPTWHDNAIAESDQAKPTLGESDYEAKENLSVEDAIAWAQAFSFPVTLHLYDEGDGLPQRG